MNWQDIKDNIYSPDGSFRDIYILNTTRQDWKMWVDFVNSNYKTTMHIFETKVLEDKIDFKKVLDYWDGDFDNCSTASVFLDKIKVNAHFFQDDQIENDITVTEITTIEDHNKLIEYMTGLSHVLQKPVILTPENDSEIVLISVENNSVKLNLDYYNRYK